MRTITSKLRTAAGITFFATAGLAFVFYVLANAIGDQTPPYDDSALSVLAWNLSLLFGAIAAAAGLLYIARLIFEQIRR